MGLINLAKIIVNGTKSNPDDLNLNFNVISDEVNGNLDENNFSDEADLQAGTVIATKVITPEIYPTDTEIIKLPDSDGSHSFYIKDYLGNVILRVKSNGDVFIY